MIWAHDREGRVTYVGGDWDDFIAPDPDVDLADRVVSNVHPADLPHVRMIFDEARRLKKPLTCVFRLRHRDGSWRRMSARGVPTISPVDGELVGLLGTTYELPPGDLSTSTVGWAELKTCGLHGPRAGVTAVADHLLIARALAEQVRSPRLAEICNGALKEIFEPYGLDPTAKQ